MEVPGDRKRWFTVNLPQIFNFIASIATTQCLASSFSCRENSWIFDISCYDLGNYSWQGLQDFARFLKIVERNQRKLLDFLARKLRISKILAREPKKSWIYIKLFRKLNFKKMVLAIAYESLGRNIRPLVYMFRSSFGVKIDRNQLMPSENSVKCRKRSQRMSIIFD